MACRSTSANTKTAATAPTKGTATDLSATKHRLHIDPVAGAELVLETVPGGEVPRMDAYLSDLANGQTELTFKLVKEVGRKGTANTR